MYSNKRRFISKFHVFHPFPRFICLFSGIILLDRLENVDISLDGDSLGFDSGLPRLRSPGT